MEVAMPSPYDDVMEQIYRQEDEKVFRLMDRLCREERLRREKNPEEDDTSEVQNGGVAQPGRATDS